MSNSYDSGRLNLPFVGIATFGKQPLRRSDWSAIDADVAVLGAPFDIGTQYRAGARFGPRAVREASTLFSFGHAGAYDHEDDATYLAGRRPHRRHRRRRHRPHRHRPRATPISRPASAPILDAGAFPVVIGGDHSVNIPCIDAFAGQEPIHILHIDAHLDFVDERHGVRTGHGSPLRRAAEKRYVTGLTQVGIRNVSSTAKDGYDAARAMGSDILSVRQMRKLGAEGRDRPHSSRSAGLRHPRHRRLLTRRSRPAPARPAMAASSTTRCWRCCRRSPTATRWSASTSSRWRPTTTTPASTAILAAQVLLELPRLHLPRPRRARVRRSRPRGRLIRRPLRPAPEGGVPYGRRALRSR